jgi:hypothetical protein
MGLYIRNVFDKGASLFVVSGEASFLQAAALGRSDPLARFQSQSGN